MQLLNGYSYPVNADYFLSTSVATNNHNFNTKNVGNNDCTFYIQILTGKSAIVFSIYGPLPSC